MVPIDRKEMNLISTEIILVSDREGKVLHACASGVAFR